MLHIIEVILKILGLLGKIFLFLLLVLLAVLLVLLLSVLFVPIRYHLEGCHGKAVTRASGQITWFLHLVSMRFAYLRETGFAYSVKLLGFEVLGNETKKPKKGAGAFLPKAPGRRKPKRKIPAGRERGSFGKQHQEEGISKKNSQENQSSGKYFPERDLSEKHFQEKDTSEKYLQESDSSRKNLQEQHLSEHPSDAAADPKKEPDKEPGTPAQKTAKAPIQEPSVRETQKESPFQKKAGGRNNFLLRVREVWRTLLSRIEAVKRFFRSLYLRMKDFREKALRIKETVSYYLNLLNAKETRTYLRKVKFYALKLLHHIRPRKASGYLRYGFEDPSVTGILTGVLYCLQPANMQGILLNPNFDCQAFEFEGDVKIDGHIRLCHIVWIAIRLFFDKNRKEIFRRLKEGGKQNGHRQ